MNTMPFHVTQMGLYLWAILFWHLVVPVHEIVLGCKVGIVIFSVTNIHYYANKIILYMAIE